MSMLYRLRDDGELPCPFCGGEAETRKATQTIDGTWHPASCGCPDCRVFFWGDDSYGHGGFATADDYDESLRQAIERWNTRAEPESDIVIRPERGDQNPVEPNVDAPDHYSSGSLECKDWIREMMTEEEYEGYLKGNVLKYLWRYRGKGKPVQDLRKAGVYVGFLVDELRERGENA